MPDEFRSQKAQQQQVSFWLHMGKALLVIVPIAVVMMLLAASGSLYSWEMFGLDPLLRSQIYKDPEIRIVEITDYDYRNYFDETSPLKRETLKSLIVTIASAKPRLLVVDLDVTPTKAERQPLPVQVQEATPSQLIIWPQTTERVVTGSSELRLSPLPRNIEKSHLGVPLFPRERDGLVRAYSHYVPVEYKGLPRLWPTLPWEAFRGGTVSDKSREGQEDELYFNFSGDRYAFDHTDVASIRRLDGSHSAALANNFKGKTVILGGNYAAARDEYFTPIGPLPGVDLVAYAMETEIRGGGMRRLQEVGVFLIDVILGCLIAGVAYGTKSPRLILAVSILLAITLPFLGSYLVFHSWNLWLSFVPVILGAIAHIAWDHFHERRKKFGVLEQENKKLKKELDEVGRDRIDLMDVEVHIGLQPESIDDESRIARLQAELSALKSRVLRKAAGES